MTKFGSERGRRGTGVLTDILTRNIQIIKNAAKCLEKFQINKHSNIKISYNFRTGHSNNFNKLQEKSHQPLSHIYKITTLLKYNTYHGTIYLIKHQKVFKVSSHKNWSLSFVFLLFFFIFLPHKHTQIFTLPFFSYLIHIIIIQMFLFKCEWMKIYILLVRRYSKARERFP